MSRLEIAQELFSSDMSSKWNALTLVVITANLEKEENFHLVYVSISSSNSSETNGNANRLFGKISSNL